jgi:predicted lipoprotein with Yx(FWY)xxD motif
VRSTLLAGSLLGITIILAACGGSSTGGAASPAATPAAASQAAASATPEAANPGPAAVTVALGDTSLGSVLTGDKGMTLYVFVPDNAGDSTCYDKCAASWPPLIGTVTPGAGLDAGDFGTTTRKDGTSQATFYGWPLYYFAADKAAGDTNGQGLNSKWYVVDKAGTMVGAAGASPSAAAASPAAAAPIALAKTSLGDVLVDGKGMTLYMFTADSAGTSSCDAACAQNWPPVIGTAAPGTGLDAGDFGTTTRSDGSTQVTFHGMPLYLFAGDKAAGDVNGQGIGTKWYVLGADGKPIQ